MVGNLTPRVSLTKHATFGCKCYSIQGLHWISAAKSRTPNGFDALQLASDINDART
jgi:hypothetical protein